MPKNEIYQTANGKNAAQEQEIPHLQEFQRWMVAVVTHFGSDEQAWNSDAATAELSQARAFHNVLPTADLDQYNRIGIYRRMYFLRMRDALEVDFPTVRHFLGQARFEAVVEEYFTECPSVSYTLNDTGLRFPAFVRSSSLAHKEIIAQIAELELSISAVMDAEEQPPVSPEAIAAIPPDAWNDARFTTVPAFALHSFTYPVHEYLCAVEDAEEIGMFDFEAHPNYVYIHRANFHTQHYALSAEEFHLLSLLCNGTPLGKAFDIIQETSLEDMLEELQTLITTRFQDWMSKGIFARIVV